MTFPLHRLVWDNRHREVEAALAQGQHDLDLRDPRGRTPLHLAISLGHLESTRVLLHHRASVNDLNQRGWTALQEAISTGDPELVHLVLQFRDHQRAAQRFTGIPELLQRLRKTPNFYVEMKWEFTSWVPLVSKICPSDVYRVWKSGAYLRVDTTLLGFDHMTWLRGNRSYIFKGEVDGAVVMEIDHEKKVVYTETLSLGDPVLVLSPLHPTEEQVASRITSPIISTHLDTKKIAFERNKSGIWGWKSERSECVNGYQAKVYSANNVELVTRTRTEHLSDLDKMKIKGTRTPLQSFLGFAEQHLASVPNEAAPAPSSSPTNPTAITQEEYFDTAVELQARDIGRPVELTSRVQRFKATLWLSETHPLSLVEQLSPIVDLMSVNNAHFLKLRDFISLQLPPGFPVKIEIPLFHVLNARITFGNLCGCDEAVDSLSFLPASDPGCDGAPNPEIGRPAGSCEIAPSVFDVPSGYTVLGHLGNLDSLRDEDDELLQYAIAQSVLASGSEGDQVTIWEALSSNRPTSDPSPPPYDEEAELERALSESLVEVKEPEGDSIVSNPSGSSVSYTEDIRRALQESQREQQVFEQEKLREEEELQRILHLSLTDK